MPWFAVVTVTTADQPPETCHAPWPGRTPSTATRRLPRPHFPPLSPTATTGQGRVRFRDRPHL